MTYYVVDVRHVCGLFHLPYVGNEKCNVFLTSIKESELNNILFGKIKRRLNIKPMHITLGIILWV